MNGDRHVIILAGPTGAGKTWWADRHGFHVWSWETAERNENEFLGGCAWIAGQASGRFAVERCAPTVAARLRLAQLVGADAIHVLDPGPEIAHARVDARGRPAVHHEHDAVSTWYAEYEPHPDHTAPPD